MAKQNIETLRQLLRRLEQEIEAGMAEVSVKVANDAAVLSERTIKQKGFGETYSEKKVPAFYLNDKVLNQKGTAFLKKRKNKKRWH